VGGLSDVDGDAQTAGEGGEAGDVVLMLVVMRMAERAAGSWLAGLHALEQLAAGEAGVDQQAGFGGGDDRGVALGAGGETVMRMRLRYAGSVWIGVRFEVEFKVRGGSRCEVKEINPRSAARTWGTRRDCGAGRGRAWAD